MKLKNLSVIYYLSLFAIIALGFLNPTNRLDLMLEIMLVGYILWIIKKGKDLTNKFFFKPFSVTACLSIPFILVFLVTSWRNSLELRTYLIHEPVSETYRSDLDDFLKTYYLMQRGQEYYLSFSQAVTENAFKGYVAQNLWAWRMPTVFYFLNDSGSGGDLNLCSLFAPSCFGFACGLSDFSQIIARDATAPGNTRTVYALSIFTFCCPG